jgi:hypothetical protein
LVSPEDLEKVRDKRVTDVIVLRMAVRDIPGFCSGHRFRQESRWTRDAGGGLVPPRPKEVRRRVEGKTLCATHLQRSPRTDRRSPHSLAARESGPPAGGDRGLRSLSRSGLEAWTWSGRPMTRRRDVDRHFGFWPIMFVGPRGREGPVASLPVVRSIDRSGSGTEQPMPLETDLRLDEFGPNAVAGLLIHHCPGISNWASLGVNNRPPFQNRTTKWLTSQS